MSDLPSRVRRAFADHGSFERLEPGRFESVSTAFTGVVDATEREDGRIRFDVTVRVPTLNEVTADDVAAVVEEGWYETFELRVRDIGGIARGDHEFDPTVAREDGDITVEASLSDINVSRGVDDANAIITFVEGTYVQGIIPGYEYTPPVTDLLSQARQQGDSGAF